MKSRNTADQLKKATKKVIRSTETAPLHILRWCRVTYPKLSLLAISIFTAYYVFTLPRVASFFSSLDTLGYLSMFIAGLLFSFGFTTPFAIGILTAVNPENLLLAALIAGCGALLADLCIYKLIKISFVDEFERLQKVQPFVVLTKKIEDSLTEKLRIYLLYALAGFIIASPLPDELGISMLAGFTTIKIEKLALVSFVMNTLGILVILLIAR